jgi:hypothetical protein
MELSRRDAVAALAAVGVGGAAGYGAHERGPDDDPDPGPTDAVVETLTAAAEVLYPIEVAGLEPFVGTYAARRAAADDAHARRVRETIRTVDDRATEWYDAAFADLPAADRDAVLREMGADTVDPAPDGTTAERVRYYLVNDLLLALYASPTGGELVGIENPVGHPGGAESYRRGP